MIYRNRHPTGVVGNFIFGLAALADGLVRAGTLGFFATTLPLKAAKRQSRLHIKRLKQRRKSA